ncbi:MAG: High-affinity zinc uptake system membrane protein ZnuB [Deltaproteobacteria bacterium]|jgi:zinc transport system permease protein|nr:High-affinity zinc uptake system membrane protein ZnuB [Deltaproteobacteria bacterium]
MTLLDDFFWRAIIAGVGVAIVAGPLGCFVVWRRMSYFGDTMAHSALLGVALGLFFQVNLLIGVFAVALAVALLLFLFQRQKQLPNDAVLGTLSHATLAMGVLTISLMAWVRVDIMGYLFGDILAVGLHDIYWIYGGGIIILLTLFRLWRPLLAITFDDELAKAEGVPVIGVQLAFMFMIAAVIALSIKIIGILLVTSLLIIPVSAARRFSKSPEQMAIGGALIGIASVGLGLWASLRIDTPSGPSIVIAAVLFFFAANLFPLRKFQH